MVKDDLRKDRTPMNAEKTMESCGKPRGNHDNIATTNHASACVRKVMQISGKKRVQRLTFGVRRAPGGVGVGAEMFVPSLE